MSSASATNKDIYRKLGELKKQEKGPLYEGVTVRHIYTVQHRIWQKNTSTFKKEGKKGEEKPRPVSWENNSAKRTAGQGVFQQILCTFFFLFTTFFPLHPYTCVSVHVCSFTFPRRYFMRKVYTAPLRRRRHLLPAIRKRPPFFLSQDILKTLSTRQLGNQKKKIQRPNGWQIFSF